MATIGDGILESEAFGFYDAMRSYDAATAAGMLAEDAHFESPWAGKLDGKEAIQEHLEGWLTDAVNRPSFSIRNVNGSNGCVNLEVSVSGRFGRAPKAMTLRMVCHRGNVQQVVLE